MQNFTLNDITVTGGFLGGRLELNRESTIPSIYEQFKQTGRFDAIKCEPVEGMHIFWDSDVYKWLESAAYLLARVDDAKIRAWYDSAVEDIVSHQRADGYFNSYYMTKEPDRIFTDRYCHELYCAGHLFEAAAASAKYLGDKRLLGVSARYADYIRERFMVRRDTAFVTPGHEEIELGLWKLYELTAEPRYKEMAEFFLTERGRHAEERDPKAAGYNQSHATIYEQTTAVGHSVRALYLYIAMADMARIDRDERLKSAVETLYNDIVSKRMYITGGVGSVYEGERFAADYFLPNGRAYSETCASIALMMFCDRMIRLTAEKKYADTLERAFYNCVLAGVSLDGDKFFYVNPLEVRMSDLRDSGSTSFPMSVPLAERVKVFSCSCCPPNLTRVIEQFPTYAFYHDGDTLAVEQFVDASLRSDIADVEMKTGFPRTGRVSVRVDSHGKAITLKVRLPDWCGEHFANERDGYLVYDGVFVGETIDIDFKPTLRRIYPNPNIEADFGKVCFSCGPMVLCAEGVDNRTLAGVSVGDISSAELTFTDDAYVLRARVPATVRTAEPLYSTTPPAAEPTTLELIPYFAHANRGETDMKVWFVED